MSDFGVAIFAGVIGLQAIAFLYVCMDACGVAGPTVQSKQMDALDVRLRSIEASLLHMAPKSTRMFRHGEEADAEALPIFATVHERSEL